MNPPTVDYFKGKIEEADVEVKKMHLAEMVRERIKNEEKKKQILNAIFKAKRRNSLNEEESEKQSMGSAKFIDALLGVARNPSSKEIPLEDDKKVKQRQKEEDTRQNNHLNHLELGL